MSQQNTSMTSSQQPRSLTSNQPEAARHAGQDRPGQYDAFESLTRRLLKVSKDEVREAEARERDKRRTA